MIHQTNIYLQIYPLILMFLWMQFSETLRKQSDRTTIDITIQCHAFIKIKWNIIFVTFKNVLTFWQNSRESGVFWFLFSWDVDKQNIIVGQNNYLWDIKKMLDLLKVNESIYLEKYLEEKESWERERERE